MEKDKNWDKYIGMLLYIPALAAAAVMLMHTGSGDVWYDELFSVKLGSMTYGQILDMTAKDVHPPMYYWYLKTFTYLFGAEDYIAACKLASFVPFAAMLLLGVTLVRKDYGWLCSGIYCLLISLMPNAAVYSVEIRMYSLCMLFLTIMGILLGRMAGEQNKHFYWVIFYLCGVLTAYTQYFALVGVGGLYIILLIKSFRAKKNAHRYKLGWCGLVVSSIFLYLPWASYLVKQLENVGSGYWIEPMSFKSLFGCIKYIYLPEATLRGYILAVLMIIVTLASYGLCIYRDRAQIKWDICIMGPAAMACMVVVGYIFTAIGSPIFTYRYMICALGIFCLGLAYAISRVRQLPVKLIMILVIVFMGYRTTVNFNVEENKKAQEYPHAQELLDSIESNSMIISNFEQVTALSAYLKEDCDSYIYDEFVTDPIIMDLFKDNVYEMHAQDVIHYIEGDMYDDIYFFGTGTAREDYVADWEEAGIKVTLVDECLIERYWINIYRLEKADE